MSAAIPTPPPRPRRRWLRGLLILAAFLALGFFATFGYLVLAARNDWLEAEAEIDRVDPRWRLLDLEADRPPIAAADNAAFVIIAAKQKGGGVSVAGVPKYEPTFEKLAPNAQLNNQQLELIEGQLKKIPAALAEARRLKDMPRGRFPITYSDDWISTRLPNHHDARTMADWLMHDAYLLAHEDRCKEALDSCRAMLNAGRASGDDRTFICHLIRLALQGMTVQTIERVLAQGEANDEQLATLHAALAQESQESNWLGAVKAERAGAHHLFENIRSRKVDASILRGLNRKPTTLSEWMMETFPTTMLKFYPDHLRYMSKAVAIAELPLHQQKKKLDLIRLDPKSHADNPVLWMLAPAFEKLHASELRGQGSLRAAMVGLACERYRLKHERWPEALDGLVAAKLLTAVPLDPMDGQPLRYRRKADHMTVYSLGQDGKDDGGHMDRQNPIGPGVDVGFRLWHPDHRRAAPPPLVLFDAGLPELGVAP